MRIDRSAVVSGALLSIASRRPANALADALAIPTTCDDLCKQRIADRRKLFEQSRTTNDRQVMFDLSKQRAAMYNTTYQGASCVPGLPCW